MQCQKLKTYMETGRVVFLPHRAIRPNPAQPRKVFREDALTDPSAVGKLLQLCRFRIQNGFTVISVMIVRQASLARIPVDDAVIIHKRHEQKFDARRSFLKAPLRKALQKIGPS